MIVFSIWTKHTGGGGGGGERSKWCNGATAAYDSGIAGAAFFGDVNVACTRKQERIM